MSALLLRMYQVTWESSGGDGEFVVEAVGWRMLLLLTMIEFSWSRRKF